MADVRRPLVSIGLSTYNRADGYLKEALQSAVDQTYPSLEIIVSDNCSQDGTEALVRGFADPRIRYFRQERNIGANNNFNFCLEQARGVYFLLLHDDDRVDPDFVTACMDAAADAVHYGVIRTGTRLIDARGRVIQRRPNGAGGLSTPDLFRAWFSGRTAFYLCSTLYNTKELRAVGGFHSRMNLYDDLVPLARLVARHGRVDVHDVKASFRRHDGNKGAAARTADWCEDSADLLDVMCAEVPDEAAALRKEGRLHFTLKNYRRASAIRSRTDRVWMYLWIYRRFGFAYSPLRWLYSRLIGKQTRRFRRALRSRPDHA
jgi:glycosyltransferase involved in cell wall biosynthesis